MCCCCFGLVRNDENWKLLSHVFFIVDCERIGTKFQPVKLNCSATEAILNDHTFLLACTFLCSCPSLVLDSQDPHVQTCKIFTSGLRKHLHLSHSPLWKYFTFCLPLAEMFLYQFAANACQVDSHCYWFVRRKPLKGERGSVSHEGPWAIWIPLYFIVACEGELIQCCTQNFPYAEGGLIKCNTKKRVRWPWWTLRARADGVVESVWSAVCVFFKHRKQ